MSTADNLKGIRSELETRLARQVYALKPGASDDKLGKLSSLFGALQAVQLVIEKDIADPGPEEPRKPKIHII